MKKVFLVGTAVYLFITAFLLGIFLLSAMGVVNQVPSNAENVLYSVVAISLMAVFNLVLGIGLIKRSGWSRIAMIIMAGFTLVGGLLGIVLFAFMLPTGMPQGAMDASALSSGLIIMLIFTVFIPLSQLVFFTRKSVAEMFNHRPLAEGEKPRPLGITILSVLTGIGAVQVLVSLLISPVLTTANLFGLQVSGMIMTVYLIISSGISLFLAYGFWHLLKSSWYTAIVMYMFGTLMITYQAVFMSAKQAAEIGQAQNMAMTPNILMLIYLMSGAGSLASLIYIISRKKYFFEPLEEKTQ